MREVAVFAEVNSVAGDAESQRFVVAALENFELAGGEQVEVLEKIEEAFVFFVDAENFGRIAGLQFGEKHAALLAELRTPPRRGTP